MSLKLKNWDTAELIHGDEDGRLLLEEIARDGSPKEIAHGIEALARARGMDLLAKELGMPRDKLFDLVNPWDETFDENSVRDVAHRLVAGRPADAAE